MTVLEPFWTARRAVPRTVVLLARDCIIDARWPSDRATKRTRGVLSRILTPFKRQALKEGPPQSRMGEKPAKIKSKSFHIWAPIDWQSISPEPPKAKLIAF